MCDRPVSRLPTPDGVVSVTVDDTLMTDTFGCRIAVDLMGTFDERTEGPELRPAVTHAPCPPPWVCPPMHSMTCSGVTTRQVESSIVVVRLSSLAGADITRCR